MSNFFEHTPQSTDVVNQVENLATEVSDAFDKVETILYQDNQKNASINSSIGDLDNKYIKEYVPNNGWINNYIQTLYFPLNSSSATLDLYPSTILEDLNNVSLRDLTNPSVTYEYKHSGVLENPTDFFFSNRKIILNKQPDNTSSLEISYKGFNTTTPEDTPEWSFELKYNVLQFKQLDNSIIKEFNATNSGNIYSITGFDFKNACSVFIQNIINNLPQELDKYVAVYSNNERIEAYNFEITNTYFRFASDSTVSNPIQIYVANSSLGKLIECLYRLFYAHDHGDNGGNGVNHKDILGLYQNTDLINYQATDKVNYDHPQYFNREGYINDRTVYNNSILGDILLSSTSDSNRKNNLEANSVKIVFGEYNSGSRLYYNYTDDCVWLDSLSRDGIKLVSPKDKRILSVNDHSFVDTQHISSESNFALKLALKTNTDEELGVFKLTRKVLKDGVEIDDDKAKFLSFSSEFSLQLIKDTLLLDNGAKISFGDPSIITLVLKEDGLHFGTEATGTLTNITKVLFDVPVKAKNVDIEHLDAKEIHLTENQRIVFGNESHTDVKEQYLNYKNNRLNIKTNSYTNIESNGRESGISLDDRQYIYTATAQGFKINDSVEKTDLFFETTRDTYFIKKGYTYTPGVTSLHTVEKSDIYCGTTYVENVSFSFDESLINGLIFNNNNKIFSQRDLSDNISTILQSNTGVIVASSYNPVGPVLNYGKLTAKTLQTIGDKDTDAGYYGNVIIPLNHRLTINGITEFNEAITFNKPVTLNDKTTANNIEAQVINTNELNVSDKATYNNLEVLEELRFNTLLQTNRTANSEFEGTVQFNNNVYVPDSNNFIILGNKEIEENRKRSGLYLSNNMVKLGVDGIVFGGKVFATKGTPSGNGDVTGGFSFCTTNGESDGDTGLFAEGNIEDKNGSDLVFRIDGVEKGRFLKEDIDPNALNLTGKEKAIVTLDLLNEQINQINSSILDKIYPLGTIYENSIDGRNPKIILDWENSVWRRYSVGRSLIGATGNGSGEQVDDYLNVPEGLNLSAVGSKFGDFTHKLVENELPTIKPKVQLGDAITSGESDSISSGGGLLNLFDNKSMQAFGGDKAHNNTHPVIVTHIWERIG